MKIKLQNLAVAYQSCKKAKHVSTDAVPTSTKTERDKKLYKYPPKFMRSISRNYSNISKHDKTRVSFSNVPIHNVARNSGEGNDTVSVLKLPFITEGRWRANGKTFLYTWDVIKKCMKGWIGCKLYTGHGVEGNEMFAMGDIINVIEENRDGKPWATAIVHVPENKQFSAQFLERIETGVIKSVSSTHAFAFDKSDNDRKVTDIYPMAISVVSKPEVTGAQITEVTKGVSLKKMYKNIVNNLKKFTGG